MIRDYIRPPKRNADIESLVGWLRPRVRAILLGMRERGFDPFVVEARRTVKRQKWLFGIGRTHHTWQRPVTWTLRSKHLVGKAVDIASRSRGWHWREFFDALGEEAKKQAMYQFRRDRCHIEWRG